MRSLTFWPESPGRLLEEAAFANALFYLIPQEPALLATSTSCFVLSALPLFPTTSNVLWTHTSPRQRKRALLWPKEQYECLPKSTWINFSVYPINTDKGNYFTRMWNNAGILQAFERRVKMQVRLSLLSPPLTCRAHTQREAELTNLISSTFIYFTAFPCGEEHLQQLNFTYQKLQATSSI